MQTTTLLSCQLPTRPVHRAQGSASLRRSQLAGQSLRSATRTHTTVRSRRALAVKNIGDDGFVKDARLKIKATRMSAAAKAEDMRIKLCATPAVAQFLSWWAASIVAPVSAVWKKLAQWAYTEMARYNEFLGQETKKEWAWKRHSEQEWRFWTEVANFIMGVLMSLLWQVCVPVSIILSIVVPVLVSWVVFDHPLLSPIGLACIIMWPLKFVPGVPWALLI